MLQPAVHLHRLRHGHARVLLAHQEDGRGAHPPDLAQRRVLPVLVDRSVLFPGRAAEPRRAVDADVALGVHRHPVGGARPRGGGFEALRVGDDLVGHVPAGAPAHLGHARAVHQAEPDEVVHPRHHVQVGLVEVVAHHVAQEVVAVAGAAPVVGLEDEVPHPVQHLHEVARGGELELVGRGRPAVGLHHQGMARPLLVVQRIEEQPLDLDAVLPPPLHGLLARLHEVLGEVVEDARHALGRSVAAHHPQVAPVVRPVEPEDVGVQRGRVLPVDDLVVALRQLRQALAVDVHAHQLFAHARVGAEEDGLALARPRDRIDAVRHVGQQHARLPVAGCRDEEEIVVVVEVEVLVRIRVEGHPLVVGRKARVVFRHRVAGQLPRIASVRAHHPHLAPVHALEERRRAPVEGDMGAVARERVPGDRIVPFGDPARLAVFDAHAPDMALLIVLVEGEDVVPHGARGLLLLGQLVRRNEVDAASVRGPGNA